MDLQYHDLRPEKSLFLRNHLERLSTDDEVEAATTEPPTDTRAYFRGKCLQRWPDSIVAANWDSLVFDIGQDPLRRVPMMEPARGTRGARRAAAGGSQLRLRPAHAVGILSERA